MEYSKVLENARTCMGKFCKACPVCNGVACKNDMPGPGSKGDVAVRNYQEWQKIYINMDTIVEKSAVDTTTNFFGKQFDLPVFAGPVGAVKLHYGDKYDDLEYNEILINACCQNNIAAFTGDGTNPEVMKAATLAIKNQNGMGIPTVKPWNIETIKEKLELVKACKAFAVAMDIDAAGLPFLQNMTPPAGSKSLEQLSQIISFVDIPFVLKGIMTVQGAKKAIEAGASAIVVSNHGGRVLDSCPATAQVLLDISKAVDGKMKILVDGGIRSGTDVFKALALGADGVIIARPFVTAVYGGKADGVASYLARLKDELVFTMQMCGAKNIGEINCDMLFNK